MTSSLTKLMEPDPEPNPKGDCWPTLFEERILFATFAPAEQASREFELLSASLTPGELKSTTLSLLPLLYRRWSESVMSQSGRNPGDEPLLERAREVYLTTWAASKRLRPHMLELLGAFHQAGIEAMLLKGAALVAGYYKDASLRPMCDFDLLVHEQDLGPAIELLQRFQWQAEDDRPIGDVLRQRRVGHAWQFSLPDQQGCDLHWRPVLRCYSPTVSSFFWDTSETAPVYGQTARIPSTTALLFHVCVHGMQWSWSRHSRWVADALTLLNSGRPIDWPALNLLARNANMTVRLRAALAYLSGRFHAPVPQPILDELAAITATEWEHREAIILLKECPLGFRDSLSWHISHFRRIWPFDAYWRKAPFWISFVSYLRTFLEAEDWRTFARKSWLQLGQRRAFRSR
jgi:hypothetical protein